MAQLVKSVTPKLITILKERIISNCIDFIALVDETELTAHCHFFKSPTLDPILSQLVSRPLHQSPIP
jgi:hypothetical protein